MPPKTIADRYTVLRAVGHGGMGTVWLCHDEVLGRDVAVKQVGSLPGESTSDVNRALREARSSAALNHPHVVSIYDAAVDGDHNWLVMEYVPSRTLAQILAVEGTISAERAAWLGAQAADGLAAAHRRGTVHRDVKPGNILVTDDDHVKITDFGIARTPGDSMLTRTGLVIGTPSYLSPELARGGEPALPADVWALGATLYAAVEGHPLYAERSNAIGLISAIATETAPPPQRAGFLTDAITRMLDRDPETRWSMTDAASALSRLHEQHPVAPPGPDTRTLPPLVVGAPSEPLPSEPLAPLPPATAPAPAVTPATPAPVATAGAAQAAAGPPTAEDSGPTRERPVPPPDPEPDPEPYPGRRRSRLLPLAALLVLAVVGFGGFLLLSGERSTPSAGTDRSATPTPAPSPSPEPSQEAAPAEPSQEAEPTPQAEESETPTPTPTPTPAAGGDPAGFVQDYYSLLPGDTRSAYERLSPAYRSRTSYGSYDGFWSTIGAVSVSQVSASGDSTVLVSLTYTTDGRSQSETRQIDLEPAGDGFVIASDAAVSG